MMNQVSRSRRQKHIPKRTCIACRAVRPKRELVRVVRTPEGVVTVDETGKENGRGADLCSTRAGWGGALSKGLLSGALRTTLTADAKKRLADYAARL